MRAQHVAAFAGGAAAIGALFALFADSSQVSAHGSISNTEFEDWSDPSPPPPSSSGSSSMDYQALDRTFYPPSPAPSTPPLFYPVPGYPTGRGYGIQRNAFDPSKMVWHGAVDIGAPPGAPVYAIADGRVFDTKHKGSCGLRAQIAHNDPKVPFNFSAAYCHLSEVLVSNGQQVKRGQIIGRIGSTGTSTGPHLHLAIWSVYNKDTGIQAFDPVPWIGKGTVSGYAQTASDPRFYDAERVPPGSPMQSVPIAIVALPVDEVLIGIDENNQSVQFTSSRECLFACYQ